MLLYLIGWSAITVARVIHAAVVPKVTSGKDDQSDQQHLKETAAAMTMAAIAAPTAAPWSTPSAVAEVLLKELLAGLHTQLFLSDNAVLLFL